MTLRQLIESDPALLAQAQAGEHAAVAQAAVAQALNATGSETQPNPVTGAASKAYGYVH